MYLFSVAGGLFSLSLSLFLRFFLLLERGEGREKEGERNMKVWLPLTCPLTGTWPAPQAYTPLGIQMATLLFSGCIQSTEPHQPGLEFCSQLSLLFINHPLTPKLRNTVGIHWLGASVHHSVIHKQNLLSNGALTVKTTTYPIWKAPICYS